MRIFTKKTIVEFEKKHSNAGLSVREWYTKASKCSWTNLNEMKNTFNSVDFVGNDRYVFNIAGNNYRLVAIVRFNLGRVFIRFIGTHSDYDKIVDIKNI